MLKERPIRLIGKDALTIVTLIERPALVADRIARDVLRSLNADMAGGLVALAMHYANAAVGLPDNPLLALVDGFVTVDGVKRPLDVTRDLKDWRSISRIQHTALSLHVDFLIGREQVHVPVTLIGEQLLGQGKHDISVTFCSAQIAAVLESKQASYVELETVLSTEDVFNIVEVLNVSVIRDWQAQQQAKRQ